MNLEVRRMVDSVARGADPFLSARSLIDLSTDNERDLAVEVFESCGIPSASARLLADGYHVDESDLIDEEKKKKKVNPGRVRLLRIMFGLGILKKKGGKIIKVRNQKALKTMQRMVDKFKGKGGNSKRNPTSRNQADRFKGRGGNGKRTSRNQVDRFKSGFDKGQALASSK